MSSFQNDILKLSTELMNCVRKNDIIGARCIVSDITEEEDRKLIVAKRDDCNAPLFEAACTGNAAMISFLVKECYADLEERGRYLPYVSLITPLLCATVMNNFEAVKSLIDLGADINAVSSCGSTPLLFVCGKWTSAVAEYLIRHGADIKKRNKYGETCLMKAVELKELCQLLIDKGADVESQDENGDLALHHAIERDQPGTVELLLDHGSDPYVKNKAGDDAFQMASLKGRELILKQLLFKLKPSVQRWIESYQLLGGYYVDFGKYIDDTDKALKFWKDAVDIQQKNACVAIIPSKPNPVYLFAQEVNTVEELDALARNRESVHMYALMIRERILGPNHEQTIVGLYKRGRFYKWNGEIRRCIDIWKYTLLLQNSGGGKLTRQYLKNFDGLCRLFYNLYEEGRQSNRSVDQLILIKESLEVLEKSTVMWEITVGNKHAEKISVEVTDLKAQFMVSMLFLIKIITELDMTAHQVRNLKNIVHRLVRCQPRTNHGRTLLHLWISPRTYFHASGEYILLLPSIAVMELLLECGANVGDVDNENNTALHLCSEVIRDSRTENHHDLMKRIAENLLKNGAHVDMVNMVGNRAVDNLTFSLMEMNMLDFVSLRCLAARAVMKYKIPYVGSIAASLESFVQMHGTPTADSDSDAVRS